MMVRGKEEGRSIFGTKGGVSIIYNSQAFKRDLKIRWPIRAARLYSYRVGTYIYTDANRYTSEI